MGRLSKRATVTAATAVYIAAFAAGIAAPSSELLNQIRETMSPLSGLEGVYLVAGYVANNLGITALAMLGSLLVAPGVMLLAVNAYVLGMFAHLFSANLSVFVAGVAPHGVFEIPALVYAVGSGLYTLYLLLAERSVTNAVYEALRSFYIVMLLILVAGFVEAYITPRLLDAVTGGYP